MTFSNRPTSQRSAEDKSRCLIEDRAGSADAEDANGDCPNSLEDMDEILSADGPSQPIMMGLPSETKKCLPESAQEHTSRSRWKEYVNRIWTREGAAALCGAVAGGMIGGPAGSVVGSKVAGISASLLALTGAGMGNLAMRSYGRKSSGSETKSTSEMDKLFEERNDSGATSLKTESQSSVLIAGSRNVASVSTTRKRGDATAHTVELPVSAMPKDSS